MVTSSSLSTVVWQVCVAMGGKISFLQQLFSNKIAPLIIQVPGPIDIMTTGNYQDGNGEFCEAAVIVGTVHSSSMERQYATSENLLEL